MSSPSIRNRPFARLLALAFLCAAAGQGLPAAEAVRVMSFNLWHGGDAGKQPLEQSAAAIRAAQADVVGLQETHGFEREKGAGRPDHGPVLARQLGWHYLDQGARTGILSRWPIVTNTPARWGAVIRHPSGRSFHCFNAHLNHAPYQPYQLLGIPYANAPFLKTAEQAVEAARRARGAEVERLLAELRPVLAAGTAVFLTGDFNEPSHQDWTARAAQAGRCPVEVRYPTTLAVAQAGLRDAFRWAHPDEVGTPGHTWTPTTRPDDPKDRHDRIDYVFTAGRGVRVMRCDIVGEGSPAADVVVRPWPSDHRAVVAVVEMP
jgi:endonuclease/exonuclease/phosphatase family metal-dependent hydrolase